jgi:hypothetical protein
VVREKGKMKVNYHGGAIKERGEREQIREVIIVLVIWKKIQRR